MAWPLNLFLMAYIFGYDFVGAQDNVTVTCRDDKMYGQLNVEEIMGEWKAVEIFLHLSQMGVAVFTSCPIITITEKNLTENETSDNISTRRPVYGPTTEPGLYHAAHFQTSWRRDYRHLRLLWDEAGQDVEYSLYFRNDSLGYWRSEGDQNGTFTQNRSYKRFSGSVQVLKAVGDHLLLNFCQEPSGGNQAQLFSILLSRFPLQLKKWEIDAAHSLLQNKKLSVTTRRLVCGNDAQQNSSKINSMVLSLISCSLAYFILNSM